MLPVFPTKLHEDAAQIVYGFFINSEIVDTVLVVNSCARGQGVPESDLDFAVLVGEGISKNKNEALEKQWETYKATQKKLLEYKNSSQFAHLHLDIINGVYTPTILEIGVESDYYEIEIGNHICYSAPMGNIGPYFKKLQKKYLPYYDEKLRLERFEMLKNAYQYDLNHIPVFIRRKLYFQAFDILCKAFQEYLQVLFVSFKVYPIAYNKWIKYQLENLLNNPNLYKRLPTIISVANIEGDEIILKVSLLQELLNELKPKR